MDFTIASFVFILALGMAMAGPVTKITEKKSLVETTKLQKEAPRIEDIGEEKDRSKKSTTTFCVEIRPGTNEAVQTPCACKDKGVPASQAASQSESHVAPASAPPSVNIIHAPPQQPQTLNIIQPAPHVHALHFVEHQPSSPAIQNVHIIQPAAQLPEPVPQIHLFQSSSKPSVENHPSERSKAELVIEPSQPVPQPAHELVPKSASQPASQPAHQPGAQKEHTEHSHKSEVHVSVVTQDNKKEQDAKPHSEKIVEPAQKPAESIKVVQVAPIRQPYEEHLVVIPYGAHIPAPQMGPGPLFQPPFFQLSSPIYQQGGSVLTQCSCKPTHPVSPNLHSMIVPSEMRAQGRTSKIMPLTILPYPVPSEKSAVSVHCNPEESSFSVPSQSHDSPMIVNLQTVRSKDGTQQGEENNMVESNLKGERTVSHLTLDTHASPYYGHMSHNPKITYDMVPGWQANLHREPFGKPMYGNQHLYVDIGRNAEPTVTDSKRDELKETKVVTPTSKLSELTRIARSEKDMTAKLEEKATDEKKIEGKTSSAKAA